MPTSIFYPLDSLGARKVIDHTHSKIHEGLHWTASHAVNVGTGTAVTVLISTPATGQYHLTYEMMASGLAISTFSEAPNASGGTAITSYNNKRNSSNADTLTITHTATYVSSGSVIENFVHGSGGIPVSSKGGGGETRNEWELAVSTLYLLKIDVLAASTYTAINLAYYREE